MSGPVGAARFVAGRVGLLLGTLLFASLVIYLAAYLVPGSTLGALTGGRSLSPEASAALIEQYGLDQSFLGGYVNWLAGVLTFDLGTSVVYRDEVASLIGNRIGVTLSLLALSLVLTAIAGLVLGMVAGLRVGTRLEGLITAGTTGALAIPPFVTAAVLVSVFAVGLGAFPTFGAGSGVVQRLWHLTLPAGALAMVGTAYLARATRTAVSDELSSRHVETARGRGLPSAVVVRRHVFRNALIPVSTAVGLVAAYLIAGAVVVENVFQLDGVGTLLVSAVEQKDLPVVQAATLLLVGLIMVISTLIDLLYPVLDPRLSRSKALA